MVITRIDFCQLAPEFLRLLFYRNKASEIFPR